VLNPAEPGAPRFSCAAVHTDRSFKFLPSSSNGSSTVKPGFPWRSRTVRRRFPEIQGMEIIAVDLGVIWNPAERSFPGKPSVWHRLLPGKRCGVPYPGADTLFSCGNSTRSMILAVWMASWHTIAVPLFHKRYDRRTAIVSTDCLSIRVVSSTW